MGGGGLGGGGAMERKKKIKALRVMHLKKGHKKPPPSFQMKASEIYTLPVKIRLLSVHSSFRRRWDPSLYPGKGRWKRGVSKVRIPRTSQLLISSL